NANSPTAQATGTQTSAVRTVTCASLGTGCGAQPPARRIAPRREELDCSTEYHAAHRRQMAPAIRNRQRRGLQPACPGRDSLASGREAGPVSCVCGRTRALGGGVPKFATVDAVAALVTRSPRFCQGDGLHAVSAVAAVRRRAALEPNAGPLPPSRVYDYITSEGRLLGHPPRNAARAARCAGIRRAGGGIGRRKRGRGGEDEQRNAPAAGRPGRPRVVRRTAGDQSLPLLACLLTPSGTPPPISTVGPDSVLLFGRSFST